jgi:hypothetical protein
MARSRRFYRPGSAGYDAKRAKELRRQRSEAKQALTSARRAKANPEIIRKAKQRSARIERELTKVRARQEERARLPTNKDEPEKDLRRKFNRLGISTQNRMLARLRKDGASPEFRDPVLGVLVEYPHDPPPKSVPDPFAQYGEDRNAMWTLYYRSLARKKRHARHMREAA